VRCVLQARPTPRANREQGCDSLNEELAWQAKISHGEVDGEHGGSVSDVQLTRRARGVPGVTTGFGVTTRSV
jgi:hypothetical protein